MKWVSGNGLRNHMPKGSITKSVPGERPYSESSINNASYLVRNEHAK